MSAICPFCLENGLVKVLYQTELAYMVAALDQNREPMSRRFLIIPKDHVEAVWDLPSDWQWSVGELLKQCFGDSLSRLSFNLSYNQGLGAGQTVPHVHCWVIVRVEDEGDLTRGAGLAKIIDRGRSVRTLTIQQWDELSVLLNRVANEREEDRDGPGSYPSHNARSALETLSDLGIKRDKPRNVL